MKRISRGGGSLLKTSKGSLYSVGLGRDHGKGREWFSLKLACLDLF